MVPRVFSMAASVGAHCASKADGWGCKGRVTGRYIAAAVQDQRCFYERRWVEERGETILSQRPEMPDYMVENAASARSGETAIS